MKKIIRTIAGGGFNSAMGRKTTQKTIKFKLLATVVCTAVALFTLYGKDNGAVTAIAKGETTIRAAAGSCSAPLWSNVYVASLKPFSLWNCEYLDCDDYNVFGEVTDCNGAPIPDVRITGYLTGDEDATSVYTVTNSYGRYRLQFPAYSNVTITVKSSDYGNYSSEVSYDIKGKSAGSWVQKIIKLPCVNRCTWNGDTSVVINGVTWATRNVDAPGTFACNPGDNGMFYQWNRKIGWSSTDPLVNSNGGDASTWDNSYSTDTTWESANDPSPAGWRIPTYDELNTLLDTAMVSGEMIEIGYNAIGCLFTDKTTSKSLLLPFAGFRNFNGNHSDGEVSSFYWSSTQYDSRYAYCLPVWWIEEVGRLEFFYGTEWALSRGWSISIRCVLK